jgi:hypothetical protein
LLGDWPFVEYKTDSGGDEYLGNSRPITIDQFDRVDSERRGWRSPVTMPKWASRWTLTVGEVAAIRARDVTEAAAKESGVRKVFQPEGNEVIEWTSVQSFAARFNLDHPGAWDRNDWCVSAAVEVRR